MISIFREVITAHPLDLILVVVVMLQAWHIRRLKNSNLVLGDLWQDQADKASVLQKKLNTRRKAAR